jgi:hypothetical protein
VADAVALACTWACHHPLDAWARVPWHKLPAGPALAPLPQAGGGARPDGVRAGASAWVLRPRPLEPDLAPARAFACRLLIRLARHTTGGAGAGAEAAQAAAGCGPAGLLPHIVAWVTSQAGGDGGGTASGAAAAGTARLDLDMPPADASRVAALALDLAAAGLLSPKAYLGAVAAAGLLRAAPGAPPAVAAAAALHRRVLRQLHPQLPLFAALGALERLPAAAAAAAAARRAPAPAAAAGEGAGAGGHASRRGTRSGTALKGQPGAPEPHPQQQSGGNGGGTMPPPAALPGRQAATGEPGVGGAAGAPLQEFWWGCLDGGESLLDALARQEQASSRSSSGGSGAWGLERRAYASARKGMLALAAAAPAPAGAAPADGVGGGCKPQRPRDGDSSSGAPPAKRARGAAGGPLAAAAAGGGGGGGAAGEAARPGLRKVLAAAGEAMGLDLSLPAPSGGGGEGPAQGAPPPGGADRDVWGAADAPGVPGGDGSSGAVSAAAPQWRPADAGEIAAAATALRRWEQVVFGERLAAAMAARLAAGLPGEAATAPAPAATAVRGGAPAAPPQAAGAGLPPAAWLLRGVGLLLAAGEGPRAVATVLLPALASRVAAAARTLQQPHAPPGPAGPPAGPPTPDAAPDGSGAAAAGAAAGAPLLCALAGCLEALQDAAAALGLLPALLDACARWALRGGAEPRAGRAALGRALQLAGCLLGSRLSAPDVAEWWAAAQAEAAEAERAGGARPWALADLQACVNAARRGADGPGGAPAAGAPGGAGGGSSGAAVFRYPGSASSAVGLPVARLRDAASWAGAGLLAAPAWGGLEDAPLPPAEAAAAQAALRALAAGEGSAAVAGRVAAALAAAVERGGAGERGLGGSVWRAQTRRVDGRLQKVCSCQRAPHFCCNSTAALNLVPSATLPSPPPVQPAAPAATATRRFLPACGCCWRRTPESTAAPRSRVRRCRLSAAGSRPRPLLPRRAARGCCTRSPSCGRCWQRGPGGRRPTRRCLRRSSRRRCMPTRRGAGRRRCRPRRPRRVPSTSSRRPRRTASCRWRTCCR